MATGGRLGSNQSYASAVEDRLAPDAYPIQLLGPEYRTIPTHPSWDATQLSGHRTLLRHARPEAWLDETTLTDVTLTNSGAAIAGVDGKPPPPINPHSITEIRNITPH